ncbi:MAG: redoxin domain-containing protein [Verrucomicrobiota bacterium]
MKTTPVQDFYHSNDQGSGILQRGTRAPDFTLKSEIDRAVTLSDFRGEAVVLVFYPADWSPVCGDQLALYNEHFAEFQKLDATLFGISVDGPWSHAAYSREHHLHFPLLSDSEPRGEVACHYGVLREIDGVSERALFVIDPEGIIFWSHLSPIGLNPGVTELLLALQRLQDQTRKE